MKDFILLATLVLGVIFSFISPGSVSAETISEINTILFVVILFLLCSRVDLGRLDKHHLRSLKFIGFYTVASAVIMTAFFKLIMGMYLLDGLIASIAVCATVSYAISGKKKLGSVLKGESELSTPILVALTYMLIAVHRSGRFSAFGASIQSLSFIQEILAGLGVGVVIGILVYLFMRRTFTKMMTLIAFAAAFFAHLLSNAFGGNGYLAVIIVGLVFGHTSAKHKEVLGDFLDNILLVMVAIAFAFLGYLLALPWHPSFLSRVIILFVILLVIRFGSSAAFLGLRPKEAIHATLSPMASPALVPLAVILVSSARFSFIRIGFVLTGFIVLSFLLSFMYRRQGGPKKRGK